MPDQIKMKFFSHVRRGDIDFSSCSRWDRART